MQVDSPADAAWAFILDPTRVVTCMPGAELVEQVDDKTYLGKVKMIYIDPPYNTGNDFLYEDDFSENAEEFMKR